MAVFRPPRPTYLGPAYRKTIGSNKPVRRIVIHSTVSPCVPGQAARTAAYFRSSSAKGSAHYAVDPKEVVQCEYDSVICWHAPPNQYSIGVEMCDMPSSQHAKRWDDAAHKAMLDLTAELVAELALAYGVPIKWRSVVGLKLRRKGITSHANVSKTWKQSSHWDPGKWPRRKFMRKVKRHVKRLRADAASR